MKFISKASPTWYENIILSFIDSQTLSAVYDIGVGPKTEYLTINKKFPDLKMFGLEANPNTYQEIVHKFPGTVLPLAVSESGGQVRYVVHEQNVMASGLVPYDNENDGEEFFVPSITLDEFDKRFGSKNGVLLWMDIEGYELKALRSGSKLLSSGRVKLINLEVRPRWNGKSAGCTEQEIDEFLHPYGYRKVFVYNHYPQSRHHDAIYCHNSYDLPQHSKRYIEFYDRALELMKTPDGMLDLALGSIDSEIAIAEHLEKISYLRSKLSSK